MQSNVSAKHTAAMVLPLVWGDFSWKIVPICLSVRLKSADEPCCCSIPQPAAVEIMRLVSKFLHPRAQNVANGNMPKGVRLNLNCTQLTQAASTNNLDESPFFQPSSLAKAFLFISPSSAPPYGKRKGGRGASPGYLPHHLDSTVSCSIPVAICLCKLIYFVQSISP